MFLKKFVHFFFFPAANIILAVFLLRVFFIAGQNVIETFPVANMTALNNLVPQPADYLWELNLHQAPLDTNKIRVFADYYEHLLQVFPGLGQAYGILGYCYHYLNDDTKAVQFFQTAIRHDPDFFWNYYDLAAIYIDETRYQEASGLLQKALDVPPMTSLKKIFTSQMVYLPLLGRNGKEDLLAEATHLKASYQGGFVLMQILKQNDGSQEAQEMIKKINPQLYAF